MAVAGGGGDEGKGGAQAGSQEPLVTLPVPDISAKEENMRI